MRPWLAEDGLSTCWTLALGSRLLLTVDVVVRHLVVDVVVVDVALGQ